MTELQRLATSAFFKDCQKEAATYVENFRGSGFYTLKKENIMYVKGRETDNGATVFKLVPPSIMQIAETFHKKYHIIGGTPVYIRTQILEAGYYMPQIVKRLKALQDRCALCRRRTQKRLHTIMGTIGSKRLTYNATFRAIQADLVGPLQIKE